MKILALTVSAALLVSGCATAVTGDTYIAMDRDVAARSHVNGMTLTSDWVRADDTLSDTFTDEVGLALRQCARGPERLALRLHIHKVERADRLTALVDRNAEHEIAAVAEFVDPKRKTVVRRYPIHLKVDAGGPVPALLADRQLMISHAFATELCRQAFG